jgi:general stress protein YciG
MKKNNKSKRGFASIDKDYQKYLASIGGKAAHVKGTAHEWTSEEAREAGRKGGTVTAAKRVQKILKEMK